MAREVKTAGHTDRPVEVQMPWFEARFTDLPRIGWAAAEAVAGVKQKASNAFKQRAKKKDSGQDDALVFEDGFAPKGRFVGSLSGRCY